MTILDRFEDDIAYLETEDGILRIPRSQLPEDVREGDVMFLDEYSTWQIDALETAMRRAKMALRRERLFRREE